MPRLADRFNDDLVAAEEALAGVVSTHEEEYAWNIESPRAVMDHARTLIDGAEQELMLAVWPQEAIALESNMTQAAGTRRRYNHPLPGRMPPGVRSLPRPDL